MHDLVTIIVPVYHTEEYLGPCISSLVNQTYENLEIILVDDGSPDKCPQICDAWAQKDKRIRVIHKKNGGSSDARNCGIKEAKGTWLVFVDSDDWIDLNSIELFTKRQIETEADMVLCRMIHSTIVFAESDDFFARTDSISGTSMLEKAYRSNRPSEFMAACNKLYRKTLFTGGGIIKNYSFL